MEGTNLIDTTVFPTETTGDPCGCVGPACGGVLTISFTEGSAL